MASEKKAKIERPKRETGSKAVKNTPSYPAMAHCCSDATESGFLLFALESRKLADPWNEPQDLWGP